MLVVQVNLRAKKYMKYLVVTSADILRFSHINDHSAFLIPKKEL